LSCGASCNLAPGDLVGLEITAPGEIRPLQALITTRFQGVPDVVTAPVDLVVNADGTATGLMSLPVPNAQGTWQVDTSVAGYGAPAIVTSIQ
jgi:hypothetical protein